MKTLKVGVWKVDGTRYWTKLEARKRIGIKQRGTINANLRVLNIPEDEPLDDDRLKELLTLHLFLGAGRGKHFSHANYLRLKRLNLLRHELNRLKIDVETAFKRITDDDYQTGTVAA